MTRKAIAGTVALLAVTASVAIAAGSDRSTEVGTLNIPDGALSIVPAKCGQGTTATGGGFSFRSEDSFDAMRVPEIYPSDDLREWDVGLSNETGGTRQAKTYVLCRSEGRFTFKVTSSTLAANQNVKSVKAECPQGSSVTGGGGLIQANFDETTMLTSRPQGKREWKVTFSNFSAGERNAYVVAMCDKDRRYAVVQKTEAAPIQRSKRTNVDDAKATAKCPNHATTTGGGYAVQQNDLNAAVIASMPKGDDSWLAHVRYYGQSGPSATSYAVCRKS